VVQYFRNPRDRSRRALLAGGGGLTPDYEYQTLKKAYGKFTLEVDLQGLGGVVSDPFDWSAGSPSAATLQTALNTMLGSGRAEVTDGAVYQIKFVGDLAEYDLPQLTLTADSSYPLNDGAGTAPTKTSQRDYAAATDGTAEVVTLLFTPTDSGIDGYQEDSHGNRIDYTGATTNYAPTAGSGWSVSFDSGSSVQFECDTPGPRNTTTASAANNSASPAVTINVAGVDPTAELLGQVVVDFVGADGWITYASSSPSFSVAIPVTALDAEVLAILNDASRYNGTVNSAAMGSTTMTVNFTATNNPGTVTIGGVTGAAVTSAVDTLQDGANALPSFNPIDLSPWLWLDPTRGVMNDGANTPADQLDPVYEWEDQTTNNRDRSQATLADRPILDTVSGQTMLTFNDNSLMGSDERLADTADGFAMYVVFYRAANSNNCVPAGRAAASSTLLLGTTLYMIDSSGTTISSGGFTASGLCLLRIHRAATTGNVFARLTGGSDTDLGGRLAQYYTDQVGKRGDGTGGQVSTCAHSHLLLFNRKLSTQEDADLVAWITAETGAAF